MSSGTATPSQGGQGGQGLIALDEQRDPVSLSTARNAPGHLKRS